MTVVESPADRLPLDAAKIPAPHCDGQAIFSSDGSDLRELGLTQATMRPPMIRREMITSSTSSSFKSSSDSFNADGENFGER